METATYTVDLTDPVREGPRLIHRRLDGLLADEIGTLATRSRLGLPGAAPAPRGETGPLTRREHEVLRLLVQGMTNDQIGTILFMSPRTASVHGSRILARLGASNRTQLAAVAPSAWPPRWLPMKPAFAHPPPNQPAVRLGRSRLVLAVSIVALLIAQGCHATQAPSRPPTTPDPQQIDAEIAKYDATIPQLDQVRAIVVTKDRHVVYQHYHQTTPRAYWDVESVTKSVVSTLVGIALSEGKIKSIDQTLADLLPQRAQQMSPAIAGTTLRQLLTMTGGFPAGTSFGGPEFIASPDWVRQILQHPLSPPGGHFLYSNASAHLVSAILQHATGMSTLDYARSRLFDPLGIPTHPALDGEITLGNLASWETADFAWPTDPQGVNDGWWGLKLRPADMLTLGELYLAGGNWHGRQLVPADWVKSATTPQVSLDQAGSPGDHYGFLWWIGNADGSPTFMAAGYGGQLIEVIPDRHLVVAVITQLQLKDPADFGIDFPVLQTILDDAIISKF